MRAMLLVVALLASLAASNAAANPNRLWNMGFKVPSTAPRTLRFGTSETAYIDHVIPFGGYVSYTAADGPNVAALIADLQNGVNNPLTFSSPSFSYTVDENYFHSSRHTLPLLGVGHGLNPNSVDLADWRIDSIDVMASNVSGDPTMGNYGVTITGGIPEPASFILFVMGVCLHGSRYHRRKVSVS